MENYEKLGAFYLGRLRDPGDPKAQGELLLYDSKDLVTHAVCFGMTGSGKTGLCIDVLEEAAIDGIPAIVIDPKGDISDLLLTFPELTPAAFLPWINEDDARQKGVAELQAQTGLARTAAAAIYEYIQSEPVTFLHDDRDHCYYQKDNLCTNYAYRPFVCRLYLCRFGPKL
jgi:DNA helicase HerA-like ATPase